MFQSLTISVRLHDGRYHGSGEQRPSPARLFQALVAAAGPGLSEGDTRAALEWLERLPPPVVALPKFVAGQAYALYVPHNDLDSVVGDPKRISQIRAAKGIEPKLFDDRVPFVYSWRIPDSEEGRRHSEVICRLASALYQFGRGVDMAWAWGELLEHGALDTRLQNHPGDVLRPSPGGTGQPVRCPTEGTLDSLDQRFAASSRRFAVEGKGRNAVRLFRQPPKPRFVEVMYASPPVRQVYDLRRPTDLASPAAWTLARASQLVTCLRDGAIRRLRDKLPSLAEDIERILVGRKPGQSDGSPDLRVKIIPLPSIGHVHADRQIRRVIVDVPAASPVRAGDIHWAFTGLEPTDPETGEVLGAVLAPAEELGMLAHYGVDQKVGGHLAWRTVTPAVLPESARRRRIDPSLRDEQAKGGAEHAAEQARAVTAVHAALRHAEIRRTPLRIRVQREPFEPRGELAIAFAAGTRFEKERLWHVEVTFAEPLEGPVVIGDGRFLGLGVLAPVRTTPGVFAFRVTAGLATGAAPDGLTKSLRRAVMARVQMTIGARRRLPRFFTGHGPDGAASADGHRHLLFLFDEPTARLLVVAPHVISRSRPTPEEDRHLDTLAGALQSFRELRAGTAGRLALVPSQVEVESDPLFAHSTTWDSLTPYLVTRHAKNVGASAALSADLHTECLRVGLPTPQIVPRDLRGVSGHGLSGSARLTFAVAVPGPIVLGRNCHFGGGLFSGHACPEDRKRIDNPPDV